MIVEVFVVAAIVTAFLVVIIYKVFQTAQQKSTALQFTGRYAIAIDDISPERMGFILLQGEHWKATSRQVIVHGQKVRVLSREGLTLIVEPIPESIDQPVFQSKVDYEKK